ncbi:hypothetical protein NUW54_g834 [Trametes sanguinea]|uniref:Uncharacterized protein n=1 Tax=Trametes sanguinea TaxID=158606 RepID=A0ACC1QAT0_9APHY|nr:hypothetical protein NUW54_g834 [Trametes sanguinea]
MTGKRARKGRSKLTPPTGGMSSTAASSSLSLKKGSASILRLPPQALRLIVEGILDDYYPPTAWFASLATICKTLLPYVEAVLYDDVLLETCPMARTYLHSVVKSQRPHRAAAVRSLALNIRKATSVVQPFEKAFAKLTNLYDLALVSDTSGRAQLSCVLPRHLDRTFAH